MSLSATLHPTLIRTLTLAQPPARGRARHLSAASGLVVVGAHAYVVADDELHLARFELDSPHDGELLRLFDGELPSAPRARKAAKPDFEALLRLPGFDGCADGALLALGSGSRANRRRGALLPLDARGAVRGDARTIELAPFYAALGRALPALNIEGALVQAPHLVLLQRGRRGERGNALVQVRLAPLLESLARDATLCDPGTIEAHAVDLGDIDGVPLCFTDGAALPDGRIVFSAAAEDTVDSYLDGPCHGAALGILGRDGRVERCERVHGDHKIEGVDVRIDGTHAALLLVTDADDADVPASLLGARLALAPQ